MLRQTELGIAQMGLQLYIDRHKNIPDTQLVSMAKEASKLARLALGMSTSHHEIHHKHTSNYSCKEDYRDSG